MKICQLDGCSQPATHNFYKPLYDEFENYLDVDLKGNFCSEHNELAEKIVESLTWVDQDSCRGCW